MHAHQNNPPSERYSSLPASLSVLSPALDFRPAYVCVPSLIAESRLLTLLRAPLPRQTRLPPRLAITLREPLTRLDHLNNVYPLLDSHKGSGGKHADPGDSRVHLVGASHLHGCGGEGAGEEHGGFGSGGRAGLDGRGVVEVGEEGRGEEGRAEGEEVEGDEEDFVHGAEGEEDFLWVVVSICFVTVLHTRFPVEQRTLLE